MPDTSDTKNEKPIGMGWFRTVKLSPRKSAMVFGALFFLAFAGLLSIIGGFGRQHDGSNGSTLGNMFGLKDRFGSLFVYRATPIGYAGEAIRLPDPNLTSMLSFEEVLVQRRSRQVFDSRLVREEELAQILFAAQGIPDPDIRERTTPSAYGVYPFNVFVVARDVEGLQPGLYQYLPETYSIRPVMFDTALLLGEAYQESVRTAPAVIVLAARYGKMREKTDGDFDRAKTFVLQESGHISQNIYLETEALGMSSTVTITPDPGVTEEELGLPPDESILYLQPIGGRVGEAVSDMETTEE